MDYSLWQWPDIESSFKKMSVYVAVRAITCMQTGGINPNRFYVIPQYGREMREEWVQRFAQHVASGARYVHSRRETVNLTPGGILYTHFSMMRLPAKRGVIKPLVDRLGGGAGPVE